MVLPLQTYAQEPLWRAQVRTALAAITGTYVTPENYGAVGDGTTDDTTAIQAAIDASKADDLPLLFGSKTYAVGELTGTGPVNWQGAGPKFTAFNRIANGVTGTAVSGGSLTSGTYYIMIFGLNVSNVVQSAYSPFPVTVNGTSTTAARMTWPAISGATKYRLWIGTTRYDQAVYFEASAVTTYDVPSLAGTSATRPDWDSPVFRITPTANGTTRHSIIGGFSINGANRASHGILWEGDASFRYTGFHRDLWLEFFYDAAAEVRDNASFGRWENCVFRTARVGWLNEASYDHQLYGCDVGVTDYGFDLNDAVNCDIYSPNAYSTNFGAIRFQSGTERCRIFAGSCDTNKRDGLILAGEQNAVFGLKFAGNSAQTANTYDDVVVSANYNLLCGLQFAIGAQLPRYNINPSGSIVIELSHPTRDGTTWGSSFISDVSKVVGLMPVGTKPAVTGARVNPEAALKNLLTQLATLGIITDSTTAA